ncbi:hypothetical protein [Bradyrhizobium sp. SYSU BS000235]|uniref:hypothetical protein n=1 Tax=Bradyrhizobium sp. SYSU BS000235 TaxID=3411332 RepID=UPI003C75BC1C
MDKLNDGVPTGWPKGELAHVLYAMPGMRQVFRLRKFGRRMEGKIEMVGTFLPPTQGCNRVAGREGRHSYN